MSWVLTLAFALPTALFLACGTSSRPDSPLVTGLEEAPLDIRQNCSLAAKRCTQCHPVERVTRAGVDSPQHWVRYVHRMRLQPGSGIAPAEEARIIDCLVYRSFGADALRSLHEGER